MPARVQVIFYRMYGHDYQLAESVAQRAREAGGAVELFEVAETLPQETLAKMHAVEAKKEISGGSPYGAPAIAGPRGERQPPMS